MTEPKRLFITGIPTAGKSYLADKLADKFGGLAIHLDDFRESLAADPKYRDAVNFYLDQDERTYLTTISLDEQWNNLVRQSEALWPAMLTKIKSYDNEERPVVFDSVNIFPYLAKRDLNFSGVILIGSSYEETLERNKKDPRWGKTEELQILEAKYFFNIERPHYQAEGEKYGYSIFTSADEAYEWLVK